MRPACSLALLGALASPHAAEACGGFFCDREQPVDQSAERIVFAIDRAEQEVEVHVQIAFEGPAEDFAWVVPTPALPELFLSTEALFDALERQTAPRFLLSWEIEGVCVRAEDFGETDDSDSDSDPVDVDVADSAAPDAGGVTVVAQQQIGALDTVTLQASSSEALLAWLQGNGFDLPDELGPALTPYVAQDSYFLALKMTKGADAGDLEPLGMRYPGADPVVPIQLTRVAAVDDMPLRVWVLADGRAVPDNYLHVEVNEAAIDWFRLGDNYERLITRAADEAGGQAFATDAAGRTAGLAAGLTSPAWSDLSALAEATNPAELLDAVGGLGFPGDSETLAVLLDCLPPPVGVEPTGFYNCPWCYADRWPELAFDAAACADAFDASYVQPRQDAARLLARYPWITRLTSSMSPSEMTADPRFVINPSMPAVDPVRVATLVTECAPTLEIFDAPRRIELPSGLVVPLPSARYFWERQLDLPEWVRAAGRDAAWLVEDTSADAAPVPIVDRRQDVRAALEALAAEQAEAGVDVGGQAASPGEEDGRGGCGCDAAGGPASLLPWLALLPLRRRARPGRYSSNTPR